MANSYDDVNGWYNQYLGHSVGDQATSGWSSWANDPNAENNIKNSAEGIAYANKSTAPTTGMQPAPTTSTGTVDPNARSQFQAAWQASPTHDAASLQALIASNPLYAGITATGDKLSLPGYTEAGTGIYRGPEQIDAIGDVGGANSWAWSGIGGPNGDGTTPGAGSNGSSASSGGTGSSLNFSSGTVPNPGMAALIQQLQARAGQSLNVSADDPNIKAQSDPYAASQDRASRNYLADQAEKQGPLANLQGESRLAAEQAGQNTGLFTASLIGKEIDSRRTEIQNALQEQGSLMTSQQQMQLQEELSRLNDATQRLGIQSQANTAANQNALGFSQLDWASSPLNPNNIPNFNSPY